MCSLARMARTDAVIAFDGAKSAAATCMRRLWTFFTCEWALGVAKVLQSITLLVSTVDVFLKLLAKDTASVVGSTLLKTLQPTLTLVDEIQRVRDLALFGLVRSLYAIICLGDPLLKLPRLSSFEGGGGSALWQA